jgi:hypothetical protein
MRCNFQFLSFSLHLFHESCCPFFFFTYLAKPFVQYLLSHEILFIMYLYVAVSNLVSYA